MPARQPNTAETRFGDLLAERFRAVRAATLELAAPLAVEDQVVQPSAETSPTKWHLGHTTWFFERFVLCARQPVIPLSTIVMSGYSTRTTTRSARCTLVPSAAI